MFNVGDKVVLVRDWQSKRNMNSHPSYRRRLGNVYTVAKGVPGFKALTFVEDSDLQAAFSWRFELYSTDLENK